MKFREYKMANVPALAKRIQQNRKYQEMPIKGGGRVNFQGYNLTEVHSDSIL